MDVTRIGSRTESFAATDDELFREQMRSSAHGDGANPRTFGYLLVKGAERRTWERLTDKGGKPFGSFRAFLESDNPYGLGMTEDAFLHAAALVGLKPLALQLLDREVVEGMRNGGDRRSEEFQSRVTRLNSESDSRNYVIARLKREDPELAERVVRGELTANAAARQAGIRKPRILVTSPESVARSLRRHMSPGDLARLVSLLAEDDEQ